MLSPDEAWRRIAERLSPLPPCEVEAEATAGRVLAAPLRATVDQPPADVSAMDGYAVAGEAAAGAELPVLGTVVAGMPPSLHLPPGSAAKIMTGALVPAGADRVIPVEETDGGGERVALKKAPAAGEHIRRCGEILRRGAEVLPAGSLLTAGAFSLIAAHGFRRVSVVRPPTVALLTTGDELVPPEVEPGPGQLRDSNTPFLTAAVASLGLAARSLGIAPDRVEELRRRVQAGLAADVLLLSGGVSMGELDLVEGVLAELGCETLFDQVAIQPGKPLVAARHPGGWVFGLPGNPASVMVTFWLFVRPVLRSLGGLEDAFWRGALAAELAAPLPGARARDRFLPATATFRAGRILATPHPARGSHDVASYARGTTLVRIPADAAPRAAGEGCEVLPLVDWSGR